MKRALLVCTLLAASAPAGPVGSFLGIELDRTTVIEHVGRDSLHLLIGGDSILDHDYVDTTRVLAETLYAGDPAWIVRRITVRSGQSPAIGYDTLVESGDTLLRSKLNLLVASLWADVYRVPFDSSTTWTMGLAGTYIGEFTGDTIIDTLSVWGDTARVVGVEDVTVPFGTVEGCTRIERRLRQRFATTIDSLRLLESAYVRVTEWYKDSLCLVKDTTVITGRVFTWFIIWIPFADLVSYDLGQLVDVHTGIVDRPALAPVGRLTASPNPFRSTTTITCQSTPGIRHSSLWLYDASGRRVFTRPLDRSTAGALDLDLRFLPAGTYFAVLPGRRPLALVKTE
jgi:hypothetical protein